MTKTDTHVTHALHDMQMIQNPDGSTSYGPHKMCPSCIARREKRAIKRMSAQRVYACCAPDPQHDLARLHARGKHNHSRSPGAMDHPTGHAFWINDPGITRAQRKRLVVE